MRTIQENVTLEILVNAFIGAQQEINYEEDEDDTEWVVVA
jgi:hypothetical protein